METFQSLPLRGRALVVTLSLIGTVSFFVWVFFLYQNFTTIVPESGGEYTEGVVSQPRYINPLLAQTSQADADLVRVLYDGLFTRNNKGEVVPHLAESYKIEDGGKKYVVTLRSGVKWHDGEPVTADDVVYTVRALQDPAFKSPLRQNWLGVEVSAENEHTLVFTLKKEYFGFLENLTLGILPKHIWQNIPSDKFLLTEYNLAPVGTGPYRFKDSEKDSSGNILSVTLSANKEYFLGAPFIQKLQFYFYENGEALLSAYNQKQIDGMYNIRPEDRANIASQKGTEVRTIDFPRTFSIFWNITKSVPLADKEVRKALSYAVDRSEITKTVMHGDATEAFGPLLPFMVGYTHIDSQPRFDTLEAEKILEAAGWKENSEGIREKGGQQLAFTLLVPDWSELLATSEILKKQFAAIGVDMEVAPQSAADLQQGALRSRDYQAVLFGQASYLHSDPYSFWHSSQKGEGGLNFAQFENKEADEVLDKIRTTTDQDKQNDLYKDFTKIFFQENPSLPLYSPKYLYVQIKDIKGVDTDRINTPAGRLSNIRSWYIYTDRVWGKTK